MIFRKELELPLIYFFLKGKKKNPKCDSLFGKDIFAKIEFDLGSSYLLGRYDKDRNTPLTP